MFPPQRAWSHLCLSLWSDQADPPVLQPVCSANKGVSSSGSLQADSVLTDPLPAGRKAGWEAETGPLGMKTSKRILIQLEKDTIVLWIPKVSRLLWTLSPFPWGLLWHWLRSEAHWYAHISTDPSLCSVQGAWEARHHRFLSTRQIKVFRVCTVAVKCCFSSVGLRRVLVSCVLERRIWTLY